MLPAIPGMITRAYVFLTLVTIPAVAAFTGIGPDAFAVRAVAGIRNRFPVAEADRFGILGISRRRVWRRIEFGVVLRVRVARGLFSRVAAAGQDENAESGQNL